MRLYYCTAITTYIATTTSCITAHVALTLFRNRNNDVCKENSAKKSITEFRFFQSCIITRLELKKCKV